MIEAKKNPVTSRRVNQNSIQGQTPGVHPRLGTEWREKGLNGRVANDVGK